MKVILIEDKPYFLLFSKFIWSGIVGYCGGLCFKRGSRLSFNLTFCEKPLFSHERLITSHSKSSSGFYINLLGGAQNDFC